MQDGKYDYLMYAPAVSGGGISLLGFSLPDIISVLVLASLGLSMGFTVYRWVMLRKHYRDTKEVKHECGEEDITD